MPAADLITERAWTCVAWGRLPTVDIVVGHESCPVLGADPLSVCPCECTTCKRAWWAAGRPIIRDGAIVRRGAA